jgi:hypothetical protein
MSVQTNRLVFQGPLQLQPQLLGTTSKEEVDTLASKTLAGSPGIGPVWGLHYEPTSGYRTIQPVRQHHRRRPPPPRPPNPNSPQPGPF